MSSRKSVVVEENKVDSTKSSMIRTLKEKGMTTSQIAKEMGIRYQFVWNVLHTSK